MKIKLAISLLLAGTSVHVMAAPFINSAPFFTGVQDQSVTQNETLNMSFTVGDVDPGHLEGLLLSVSSLTPSIFDLLVLGGTGANRTLSGTPLLDQTGPAQIQLQATDPLGLTSTRIFNVNVSPKAAQPTPDGGATGGLTLLAVGALAAAYRHRK